MAITIRTGANGSYKSAYSAYFVILSALKAGKVVVTNIEGMEPMSVIEKRLNITFPTTSKLIRVFSRDAAGVHLWTHFFCWCPIGAQIVIDECQDIYSKNIGFDMKKVTYKPVEDFITKNKGEDGLLPESYLSFFYSRYVPADMEQLQENETDDRGIAEYDEQGRIIYPHTFNEGFQRHRKYNWDIELLSPDWKQIDTAIKACGEQNFFHKGRDQFFWTKRKPLIWKHDKSVSTPVIPKSKDVNTTTQKIPLDSFLLYKSTGTGVAKAAGAMNTLFRSPKVIAIFIVLILCLGYLTYELSSMAFGSSESVQEQNSPQYTTPVQTEPNETSQQGDQVSSVLPHGRSSGQADNDGRPIHDVVTYYDVLPFEGIKKAYFTSFTTRRRGNKMDVFLTFDVITDDGIYSVNDRFLAFNNVQTRMIDDCFIQLTRKGKQRIISCSPRESIAKKEKPKKANIKLL